MGAPGDLSFEGGFERDTDKLDCGEKNMVMWELEVGSGNRDWVEGLNEWFLCVGDSRSQSSCCSVSRVRLS